MPEPVGERGHYRYWALDRPQIMVSTIPGLEDVAAGELTERIGARIHQVRPSGVGGRVLAAVQRDMMQKVFSLRSIEHVVLLVKEFRIGRTLDALDEIYEQLSGLEVDGSSFRITCERFGEHQFSSMDVERVAGQAVLDSNRIPVNLSKPDTEIRVDVLKERCLVGIKLTKVPLHVRYRRAFEHPSALNPVVAYAMLRLSGMKKGDQLLDPFCGGGTIPIEAAQGWRDVDALGVDINPRFVEGAKRNAAAAGLEGRIRFVVGDATDLQRCLPKGWVPNRVVSNLPFGLRSSISGPLDRLYEDFLRSLRMMDWEAESICLLTSKAKLLREAARRAGFRVRQRREISYGGITSWINLLEQAD